jgi:hypothetical protein
MSYFAGEPALQASVVANINKVTLSPTLAPDPVKWSLKDRFKKRGGKVYPFGRLGDRIQFGMGIIDWVYDHTTPFDQL